MTASGGIADWWTPRQTADYIGVQPQTLAKWRSQATHPDLPYHRLGRRILYQPDAVRTWFDNHLQRRTSTQPTDCTRHRSLT